MLANHGLVREAADPNSAAVATVPAGTPLRFLHEVPAWYFVAIRLDIGQPDLRGYISVSDAEWIPECAPLDSAQLQPSKVFRDCDVAPKMTVLPPGKFWMGSPDSEAYRRRDEGPQREVTIPAPFAVGVFEVTFEQWDTCVRMGGCDGLVADDEGWGREQRPALNINWPSAQSYVRWLSNLTGKRYRLLSESEWEYAARAGSTTPNYWEPGANPCAFASMFDQSDSSYHSFDFQDDEVIPCTDGFAGTAPVGSFRPNAFGLYDMIGNAAEWTQDCYNADYSDGPTDGSVWESGLCLFRVARGGGWFFGMAGNRSAARTPRLSNAATSISGFRVARDLE